jgi:hypothetical protein
MLQPDYVEMFHGNAFPAVPFERQAFYRDDLHMWFIYNGTVWVSLTFGGLNYIDLPEIIPPANPPADTLRLYVEDIHGFPFFSFRDSTGMVRKIVRDSVFIGLNVTGADIPSARAVYASGNVGGIPTIALARADAIATMPAIGITVETIANGAPGRVIQVGLLENVNTSAFAAGDVLYVSATIAGAPTNVPPLYPNIRQEMGTVLVSDIANGAVQCVARSMMNEGILDHGGLLGLADDDHPQYILHSLATAIFDFLVASGPGVFIRATLAQVKVILNWAADIVAAIEAHRAGAVHTLPQPPQAHAPSHEPGGSDAMAVNAVAGTGSLRTLAGTGAALSAARSDHTHTLQDDTEDRDYATPDSSSSGTYYRVAQLISASSYYDLATITDTYAPGSRACGVAWVHGQASAITSLKLQLIMGGVMVAESGYLSNFFSYPILASGFRAMSGSQTSIARIKNYYAGTRYVYFYDTVYYALSYKHGGIYVGSIKI